jgi:peptidoglycan/xylan/chitin deacetylase (PgdA/CDA1 family)
VLLKHVVSDGAAFGVELDQLLAMGYTTVTLDEIYEYLLDPVASKLPLKPVLITFDDGGMSNFTNAFPQLQSRNMKATMYLVPNWMDNVIVGQGPFLEATHFTWANAVTMFASGLIDFQSHTMQHLDMRVLSGVGVIGGDGSGAGADFLAAKARIEAMIPGQIVRHNACPYGNFNAKAEAALRAAGCRTSRLVGERAGDDQSGAGVNSFVLPGQNRMRLTVIGTDPWPLKQANFYGVADYEGQLIWDPDFKGGGYLWTKDAEFTIESGVTLPDGTIGKCLRADSPPGTRTAYPQIAPLGLYSTMDFEVWIKTDGMAANSARVFLEMFKSDGATVTTTVGASSGAATQGQPLQAAATAPWTKFSWTWPFDLSGGLPFFVRPKVTVNTSPGGIARFWGLKIHRRGLGHGSPPF